MSKELKKYTIFLKDGTEVQYDLEEIMNIVGEPSKRELAEHIFPQYLVYLKQKRKEHSTDERIEKIKQRLSPKDQLEYKEYLFLQEKYLGKIDSQTAHRFCKHHNLLTPENLKKINETEEIEQSAEYKRYEELLKKWLDYEIYKNQTDKRRRKY